MFCVIVQLHNNICFVLLLVHVRKDVVHFTDFVKSLTIFVQEIFPESHVEGWLSLLYLGKTVERLLQWPLLKMQQNLQVGNSN